MDEHHVFLAEALLVEAADERYSLRVACLEIVSGAQRGQVGPHDHGHRIASEPRRLEFHLEINELERQISQTHSQRRDIAGKPTRTPRRAQVAEDHEGNHPATVPAFDVVMVIEQAPGQGGVALCLHFDVRQPVGGLRLRRAMGRVIRRPRAPRFRCRFRLRHRPRRRFCHCPRRTGIRTQPEIRPEIRP